MINRYNDWDSRYYGRGYSRPYRREYDYDYDYDIDDEVSWTYSEYWWIPGPYTGRGPRGYQRTDERIQDDVNERLAQHGQVDASDIEVEVNNGEVTLKGMVDSRRAKRMAEDVVDSVFGVRDVHNQLRVSASQPQARQAPGQIQPGMEVVDSQGQAVGTIKEVRNNNFLVDRALARDVYVPLSACRMSGDRVMLNVPADQVDNQGWPYPELLITGQSQ